MTLILGAFSLWKFGFVANEISTGGVAAESAYNSQGISSLDELVGERGLNEQLEMVGAITIPDLKINLPIFRGDGEKQLDHGAGTVGEKDFASENFSLAAHQVFGRPNANNLFFGPLVSAQKGQLVFVADKENIYEYQIAETFIVNISDVEVLETVANRKVLTLIYCTDEDSDRRTIVRADFISAKVISEMNSQKINYFRTFWNVLSKTVQTAS
ncbi:MAG: class A sortase [Streptococcaceae bacterium]|nr:class A sortase [Streptococcaceae bacterium]